MDECAILHSDMNSFYASVEMMLDPSLKGKAIAVCGSVEERHGIVLAKSDLAKKAGVKTGMVSWQAKQLCPELILVPPQYDEYLKYSKLAHGIYERYTPLREPFGMDECWLDVTSGNAGYSSPRQIAEEIRAATREELGLTVSIGVSFNKIFAKLGSDLKKPDARATPPKAKAPTPDYYQPDQMDEILNALENAPLLWKTITYIMIDSGCRRGEALGLKWSSLELDTGLMVIENNLQYTKKTGIYLGPTKTGKVRALKLAPQCVELLKEWKLEQMRMRLKKGSDWKETGMVFTKDNGEWLHPDSITILNTIFWNFLPKLLFYLKNHFCPKSWKNAVHRWRKPQINPKS